MRSCADTQLTVFVNLYGAPTRTRTADLLITNQLLYQLSYRGTRGRFKGSGAGWQEGDLTDLWVDGLFH